jgi:hypothetical protein
MQNNPTSSTPYSMNRYLLANLFDLRMPKLTHLHPTATAMLPWVNLFVFRADLRFITHHNNGTGDSQAAASSSAQRYNIDELESSTITQLAEIMFHPAPRCQGYTTEKTGY